jgi:hypothetical protein
VIQQKVKLVKQETNDKNFRLETDIGSEFWVNCNTIRMSSWQSKETGKIFKALCVQVENGIYVPVEVLEFTNDFRTTQ